LVQIHALEAYRGSEATAAQNNGSMWRRVVKPHAPAALPSLKRLQYQLEIRLDVLQG